MKYIKLIEKGYDDWYGKLNEKGEYVSYLPCYHNNVLILHPMETHIMTLEEMQQDSSLAVIEITKDEYWENANSLLVKYYNDEIESLKAKIRELEHMKKLVIK